MMTSIFLRFRLAPAPPPFLTFSALEGCLGKRHRISTTFAPAASERPPPVGGVYSSRFVIGIHPIAELSASVVLRLLWLQRRPPPS